MTGGTHGGNIYRHARMRGCPEEEIVDFSASINPLGLPDSARRVMMGAMEGLVHYPDPDALELVSRISGQTGLGPDSLICGNGSTELIYLVPRALRPRRVLIPAPTFSEYERACSLAQVSSIIPFPLDGAQSFEFSAEAFLRAMEGTGPASAPCDMAFLCNPNNPTGRLVKREKMAEIAAAAARAGCVLVVDEAFIDFCPHDSIVDEVARNPYLIVLRSLTKFYALSGLRVGYMAAHPGMAQKIREFKEPWTINTFAQKAAVASLDDKEYGARTHAVVAREKAYIEERLRELGIAFIPGAANFYLLRLDRAAEVREALAARGILVRDCTNFEGLDESYIRIAVRSRAENERLFKEMASCGRL